MNSVPSIRLVHQVKDEERVRTDRNTFDSVIVLDDDVITRLVILSPRLDADITALTSGQLQDRVESANHQSVFEEPDFELTILLAPISPFQARITAGHGQKVSATLPEGIDHLPIRLKRLMPGSIQKSAVIQLLQPSQN